MTARTTIAHEPADAVEPDVRTSADRGKGRRPGRRSRGDRSAYAFIAPYFLVFAAFGLFPLLYTLWISLYDYRLGSGQEWIGLENFRWLFTSSSFYNAVGKTFTIGVISTVPQLLLALGLAHMLNYRLRVRMFFRISMILPYATSVAAATLVFAQIFASDGGFANWTLSWFGIDAIDWRNGNWTAQVAISLIVIWHWTGYNALIYLAGMQTISYDLYESAALDGANKWQQFRHITLPGLRPTILFTIVVSTIGATQLFAEPLLFGGGTPNGGSTHQYQTLGLLMYQQGWQFGALGRAAAIAWVSFLLIVVLVLVNMLFVRWRTRESLTGDDA